MWVCRICFAYVAALAVRSITCRGDRMDVAWDCPWGYWLALSERTAVQLEGTLGYSVLRLTAGESPLVDR